MSSNVKRSHKCLKMFFFIINKTWLGDGIKMALNQNDKEQEKNVRISFSK